MDIQKTTGTVEELADSATSLVFNRDAENHCLSAGGVGWPSLRSPIGSDVGVPIAPDA
jgi:hypothetical protein